MNFKTPAIIATLALTATASFASGDENNLLDDYLDAQAHAKALSAQLETMGVESNPNVEFNSPATLSQKLDAYQDKISDLQSQFDTVRTAN
ncbi:MAG: hypothetical protein CMG93_04695 [Marinomonas sp.]|jgi:hypothetical protein|uniref:Uncharacterized protein n=1 Tax=Marinomonas communis TaxID=28254 RepID=A0A4R6XD71_9GAMM|nr:hypothetical protein [Marinomonas communis]MAF15258.1 hypothetical protein [Marinomonas sp.]MCC4273022.1 hypothetical protein [Marinomonas communis]RUM51003.1 MAG: hypothetical protein DSY85_12660 [Marinomonas sp.]RUM54565.1 MAG: hypothetical protein DSY86_03405 [Marinomonas sp.]TDR15670.1 hypothetical protein C8D85_1044 [Marinomonas communis]